jgi:hypothetical protein
MVEGKGGENTIATKKAREERIVPLYFQTYSF